MKITINKIRELNPCNTGYQRLLNQLGSGFDKDKEFEVSSLVGGENTINDITWLLGEAKNKRVLVEFAVFCAELVLPIYENTSDNKAPGEAIELVKKWLDDASSVTKCELSAAYAAAYNAAYNAADAAYAAAYNAAAVAAYATYAAAADAADAADAAAYTADTADAAYAAAPAAAYAAAARDSIRKQINAKLVDIVSSVEFIVGSSK